MYDGGVKVAGDRWLVFTTKNSCPRTAYRKQRALTQEDMSLEAPKCAPSDILPPPKEPPMWA